MLSSEIRSRFLRFFERHDHAVLPSSSLIPADDPTLLFTNAGMVQFKRVFLGLEQPARGPRATTSQKCVRAGGKHNDLEQVGHTARHHTFFEMLGNFSFGDYFKREAIRFAWEFVTQELNVDPRLLRVTVYRSDDEARSLWREIAGLADHRIYGLGEKDNFWQMADTGPCGPCTEIYVDLAHQAADWSFPEDVTGEWTERDREEFSLDAFVEGAEAGRFLEIWNLVFMQYDRQADGALVPLPKPSVDTGAGLERIAAVMQRVTNNFDTDLFAPLIQRVEDVVGRAPALSDVASFRVIADHARAVAFLLADGVFPSNEGRGYVLRRILRRAVRHAWLLDRAEPTVYLVAQAVIDAMGDVYPELRSRATHIVETTRAEEERFLATIDGGMRRFNELARPQTTHGSSAIAGTISGDDAFRLYDTFGFPLDLTELMARERGYTVDTDGFTAALEAQRRQSQEDRRTRNVGVSSDALTDLEAWEHADGGGAEPMAGVTGGTFVGYDTVQIETDVTAIRRLDGGRVAVLLRETPFYAESGGQVSDAGEIVGEGWRVTVDEVRKIAGRNAAVGELHGEFRFSRAIARVPTDDRRSTERNHTATHLLHAALRKVLGDHVHQAGSLVAPTRLRFDYTHHGPVRPDQLREIEALVNREIWRAIPVEFRQLPYRQAVAAGAMALFGEKYSDVVRVVNVPGFSMELCGGTHVRNTSEIALFRIVSETGIGAGQRRIEAVTGPRAYDLMRERENALVRVAELVKATPDTAPRRVQALVEERRALERQLDEARKGGGAQALTSLLAGAARVDGSRVLAAPVEVADAPALSALGDAVRAELQSGVGVLGASLPDGKNTLLVVVTDDLRDRGVRADAIVREVAATVGGRGGGKPHMAQAGIPSPAQLDEALRNAPEIVRAALAGTE